MQPPTKLGSLCSRRDMKARDFFVERMRDNENGGHLRVFGREDGFIKAKVISTIAYFFLMDLISILKFCQTWLKLKKEKQLLGN